MVKPHISKTSLMNMFRCHLLEFLVVGTFFLSPPAGAQITARDVQIGTNPMRWEILVRNDHHYTITLQYSFSNLLNASLVSSGGDILAGGTNYYAVVAAKTEIPLFVIGPALPGGWTWNWATSAGKGNALLPEMPDTAHIYRLPYLGGNYHVGWSYKSYTPYGQPPDYWHLAIDWIMPEWTPVVAARGGKVSAVVESNTGNGNAAEGNFIEVEHSDSTFAVYIHLVQNGSVVNEGDLVTEGQLIGYSGNTGASSGPHLHFHVWRSFVNGSGFVGVQLPVRFFAENGWGFFPRPGRLYKAMDRADAQKDLQQSGTVVPTNGIFVVRKTGKDGLLYTPQRSSDLKIWISGPQIAGNGTTLTQELSTPSGDPSFFRWATEMESYADFPDPWAGR